MEEKGKKTHFMLLAAFLLGLLWSGIHPHDYLTWALEVFPAVAGAAVLVATWGRFRFTLLVYALIFIQAWVLLVGAHYTYAEVPAFNWLKEHYGLSRNYYDRVGHFFQGFTPALVAREILIRKSPVKKGGWLFFLVVTVCLSISAFYELIEWWVAAATGTAATEFLATQGDIWDTQWDMFMALTGSILSLLALGGAHDRMLQKASQGMMGDLDR